ncbi:hypothetical protein GJ496_003893 [Pomphorhynchus laevis]|nr:hypothetical protein GJ496_003893 [Pomphorhynchus laevis]
MQNLEQELKETISALWWSRIVCFMRNRTHVVYNNKVCRLVRKYHALQPRSDSPQDCVVVNEKPHSSSFLNLSDKHINDTVASLLYKGLTFGLRPFHLAKETN